MRHRAVLIDKQSHSRQNIGSFVSLGVVLSFATRRPVVKFAGARAGSDFGL